jgi:excisionase family DNA binding protein
MTISLSWRIIFQTASPCAGGIKVRGVLALEKMEGNMLNVEIRFVMQGKEVSVHSFVEVIMREVRTLIREQISRTLTRHPSDNREPSQETINELSRRAVSVREAARLLSISLRTIQNYIALNAIRTVRVGRRVLVPMKSVNEVATRGIPSRRSEKSTYERRG